MEIELQGGFQVFHNAFQQSTINDFRNFIAPFDKLGVTKWIIYSDYCFNDPKKYYNAMTFTIIPYVDQLDTLKQYICDIAPDDLKHTKEIDERFGRFIKSGYLFNLAMIYKTDNNLLFTRSTKNQLSIELKKVSDTFRLWMINTPQNRNYYASVIKKINNLQNELGHKTFNLNLLQKIIIIHAIVSYLLLVLTNETLLNPEIIGWFSDRDSIITAYKSIIYDLVHFNYHNLCDAKNIKDRESRLAYTQQDLNSKQLWYDELLRVPDYLSGALAGRNHIGSTEDKYDQLFKMAIRDNPYLSVIKISYENGFDQASRVTC